MTKQNPGEHLPLLVPLHLDGPLHRRTGQELVHVDVRDQWNEDDEAADEDGDDALEDGLAGAVEPAEAVQAAVLADGLGPLEEEVGEGETKASTSFFHR